MLLYRKITRIQSVYTQFSSLKFSFIYTEAHDSIHLKVLSGLYAIEKLCSNYLQSGKKNLGKQPFPPFFVATGRLTFNFYSSVIELLSSLTKDLLD